MGTREPGALTKAIDQLRADLVESSDPELRTTYADLDALLVVLETAREAARQELVVEWMQWAARGDFADPRSLSDSAALLLRSLDALDQPFEHGMPPKEIDVQVVCGAISYDGNLICQLSDGHTDDHQAETEAGTVRWARMCKSTPMEHDGVSPLPYCDLSAGHEGDHFDSGKGVAW